MFAMSLAAHSIASGAVPSKVPAKPAATPKPIAKVAPKRAVPAAAVIKRPVKAVAPVRPMAKQAPKPATKIAQKVAPKVAPKKVENNRARFAHKKHFHKHSSSSSSSSTSSSSSSSSSSSDCHKPTDKWFIVVHENADASTVLSVPEYADFAERGTYFSNYSAITHPSQPNYIAMIAGDTFEPPEYGDASVDFPNPDRPDANSTIIDLIEQRGLSWKVYIENYPEGGTTDDFRFLVYPMLGVIWDLEVSSGPAKGHYPAVQALFGAQTGLPAATLIATPNLDGTPGPGQDFTGKIVVVSRGAFSFTSKAKNAQDAGAVGVIIYNSVTGTGAFTRGDIFDAGGVDPTVTIPVFGISHPSGLEIAAGVTTDPTSTGQLIEDPSIPAHTAQSPAMYARKHNPFMSFLNISQNPARASKLVNAREFAKDLENDSVPDFAFYIPNQFNDAHDTALVQMDYNSPITSFVPYYGGQAFATSIGVALANKAFTKDRVIVLTFDEDDASDSTNRVYCAFVGEHVQKNNVVDAPYNHYSLLRTIEDSLKVGTLGRNDTTSVPMTGWRK